MISPAFFKFKIIKIPNENILGDDVNVYLKKE